MSFILFFLLYLICFGFTMGICWGLGIFWEKCTAKSPVVESMVESTIERMPEPIPPRGYTEDELRATDRQGNIYTISEDNTLNNSPPRFSDFFHLEPGSEEAARIRAQLEKDDKELPSYDEVMRMTSLPQSPMATESGDAARLGISTSSIATTTTTDISIPAPPYSEVDLNATMTAATAAATSSAIAGTPSTSRAAASVVVANSITTTRSTNA